MSDTSPNHLIHIQINVDIFFLELEKSINFSCTITKTKRMFFDLISTVMEYDILVQPELNQEMDSLRAQIASVDEKIAFHKAEIEKNVAESIELSAEIQEVSAQYVLLSFFQSDYMNSIVFFLCKIVIFYILFFPSIDLRIFRLKS